MTRETVIKAHTDAEGLRNMIDVEEEEKMRARIDELERIIWDNRDIIDWTGHEEEHKALLRALRGD